jgi:hypothetical protein
VRLSCFNRSFPDGPLQGLSYDNLSVTDNQTNIIYFYTIDKDKAIGSELRLRGRLDFQCLTSIT